MGLYSNIHAKRKRIKNGSKETMNTVGSKGCLLYTSPSPRD